MNPDLFFALTKRFFVIGRLLAPLDKTVVDLLLTREMRCDSLKKSYVVILPEQTKLLEIGDFIKASG